MPTVVFRDFVLLDPCREPMKPPSSMQSPSYHLGNCTLRFYLL